MSTIKNIWGKLETGRLFVAAILFWFSLYAYMPVFAPYAEIKCSTHTMVGLILGSYGFMQMILRVPIGILSDLYSKRTFFIRLGALSAFISSTGLWLFVNPNAILFFRAMAGVAASTWGIFIILLTNYNPTSQIKKSVGFIQAMSPTGQLLATIIGGTVAELFAQRTTFFVAAAGGFLCFILTLGINDYRNDAMSESISLKDIGLLATNKSLLLVSGLAAVIQFVTYATVYGFTPVIANNIGAGNFELGLLTTLSIVPGIFASIICGSGIIAKIGERKTIIGCFLITTCSIVVIPYVHTVFVLILTQFIGGFSRMLAFTMLLTISLSTVSDNNKGTAISIFQAFYGIGMFVGPSALGIISEYAGLRMGFWIVGLITGIGSLGTILLDRNPSGARGTVECNSTTSGDQGG